jgi:flagellar hook assembly protein FlgD
VTQRSAVEIFYGQPEDISPEFAVAGNVFPNPVKQSASDAVTFPFALPPSARDYFVHIEVLDARGLLVKNVLNEKFSSGFHEAKWEGGDENNKRCTAGMYVYRVTISSEGKLKTTTGKLIITN